MDRRISAEEWRQVLALMPQVRQRLDEKRRQLGADHVRECWRRSVVEGEPNQMFLAEGPLTIGAWPSDLSILAPWIDPATHRAFPGCFLVLLQGDTPHA